MSDALALPLALVEGRTARCSACVAPCQGTLRGPGELVPLYADHEGDGGGYRRTDGAVLCRPCHARVWTQHLAAVRDRLALIALSRVIPCPRRSDLERLRRAGDRALDLTSEPLFAGRHARRSPR